VGGSPFAHAFNGDTYVGINSGNFTMTGTGNTALGNPTLVSNSTGQNNTALGSGTMAMNTMGNDNTAVGLIALANNSTGSNNTAVGRDALNNNSTGDNNTAVGLNALFHSTGTSNIGLGMNAGVLSFTGSNNIYIGSEGAAESSVIRIGTSGLPGCSCQTTTFIAGIAGVKTGGTAVPVLVDANGQLGTISSSRRFKYDIQDMGGISDNLLRLRPVAFRYKQAQNDGSHPLQYGLIAEEVAEVYPELVQRAPTGEVTTVLYHLLPAMLLNEVQKQQRLLEEQQRENEEQRITIARQRAEIQGLAARLARLEAVLAPHR